jgi:hypothetical protein
VSSLLPGELSLFAPLLGAESVSESGDVELGGESGEQAASTIQNGTSKRSTRGILVGVARHVPVAQGADRWIPAGNVMSDRLEDEKFAVGF